MKKLLVIAVIMAILATPVFGAGEQETAGGEYPTRNITALIPYSPGGGSDTLTRNVDEHIKDILGVSFDFKYQEGAGGAVGVTALSQSKADGYTIGAANIPHILLQEMTGTGQFTVEDFDYIGQVAKTSLVLVTPKNSPYTTIEGFIKAAKAAPGTMAVGLPGALGDSSIAAWLFQEEAGLELELINYSGGADMLSAILGGHIDAAFSAINMAVPEKSQMNLLATVLPSGERADGIEEVKTLSEYGYDVEVTTPRIYLAPKGIPEEAYNTLVDAFAQVSENPDFQQSVKNLNFIPDWMPGPELNDYVMELKGTLRRLLDTYHTN